MVIMWNVKTLFKLTLWILFLMISSCITKNREYKISKFATVINSDSAILVINVRDSLGEKSPVSAVKINNKEVYKSDSLGNISFNLIEGRYTFMGLWLHHSPRETEDIYITSGDSIIIDFFLKSDTKPLYNKR